MGAVGGSILEVNINGRLFSVPADADAQLKVGGKQNAVEGNGDGTARLIKTVMPWTTSGLSVVIDHDRGDMEFLQGVADGNSFVPVSVTLVDLVTWAGSGQIVDELAVSSQSTTAPLSLAGTGVQEQQ